MFLAMGLVVVIFVLPAVAISFVVPAEASSRLTAGVMQAFPPFFDHFHVALLTPILGIMLITRVAGRHDGLARRPLQGPPADRPPEGYLPPFFQKVNEHGIQVNILYAQGAIVSVIALLFALIPNVQQRVLDLLGDHHAGVPDHVRADVHSRRYACARTSPTIRAATGRPSCRCPGHRRAGRVGPRLLHRLRTTLAVRRRQPGGLLLHDPHRRGCSSALSCRSSSSRSASRAGSKPCRSPKRLRRTEGVTTMQEKSHTWISVVIVVTIVALMAVGVAVRRQESDNREAHAKAQELITKLEAAGFQAPQKHHRRAVRHQRGRSPNPGISLLQAQLRHSTATRGRQADR